MLLQTGQCFAMEPMCLILAALSSFDTPDIAHRHDVQQRAGVLMSACSMIPMGAVTSGCGQRSPQTAEDAFTLRLGDVRRNIAITLLVDTDPVARQVDVFLRIRGEAETRHCSKHCGMLGLMRMHIVLQKTTQHLSATRSHLSEVHHEMRRPAPGHRLRRDAEDGAVEQDAAVGAQQARRRPPPGAALPDQQRRRLQASLERPSEPGRRRLPGPSGLLSRSAHHRWTSVCIAFSFSKGRTTLPRGRLAARSGSTTAASATDYSCEMQTCPHRVGA